MSDKKANCDYAKATAACTPKCACDDATYKAAFDANAQVVKTTFDCDVTQCGASAAAGLRASVLTGILAAFVAIFAAK